MQKSKGSSNEINSSSLEQSTKGWNWGWYHMKKDRMEFTHDREGLKTCFGLKYKDIAISNATKENEVQLEFQQEQESNRR